MFSLWHLFLDLVFSLFCLWWNQDVPSQYSPLDYNIDGNIVFITISFKLVLSDLFSIT